MKVLITGATGFLGSHIAEIMAAEGHDVRVLLRKSSSRRFLQGFAYEEAIGDITDPTSLPAAVAGAGCIIHAAGLTTARSVAQFQAVNVRGTAALLAAAEQHAPDLRRFIYVSSLAAHGPSPDGVPRPVDAEPNPITAYGRSKLAGERLTRESSLAPRSVIFRPPAIYGPRDAAFVPFFQLARFRIAPLLMGGRNRISIVYVEDAARAIALAATAEAAVNGRTYCFDDGNTYSWRDLLSAIEQAMGHRVLCISTPLFGYTAAALASEAFGTVLRRAVTLNREKVREMAQRYWVCSHKDFTRDTGWTPATDIWQGARLTRDWYRRHRWI